MGAVFKMLVAAMVPTTSELSAAMAVSLEKVLGSVWEMVIWFKF